MQSFRRSPDGVRWAYLVEETEDAYGLYVADLDLNEPRRVADLDSGWMHWSSDGTEVIYKSYFGSGSEVIEAVSISDGARRTVAEANEIGSVVGSHGGHVYFTRSIGQGGATRYFLVQADMATGEIVRDFETGYVNHWIVGDRMMISREGATDPETLGYYDLAAEDFTFTEIPNPHGYEIAPAISPDGTLLKYGVGGQFSAREIHAIDAATGSTRIELVAGDGSDLGTSIWTPASDGLVLQPAAVGEPSEDLHIHWLNGTVLSLGEPGRPLLAVRPVAEAPSPSATPQPTPKPEPTPEPGPTNAPSASPSLDFGIYFAPDDWRDDPFRHLDGHDIATRATRQLTTDEDPLRLASFWLYPSLGGDQIALRVEDVDGSRRLVIADTSLRDQRTIAAGPDIGGNLSWTRDGTRIVFDDRRGTDYSAGISMIDVTTGETEELVKPFDGENPHVVGVLEDSFIYRYGYPETVMIEQPFDGGEPRVFSIPFNTIPTMRPGSSQVFFYENPRAEDAEDPHVLYVVDFAEKELEAQLIPSESGYERLVRQSPDGRYLAVGFGSHRHISDHLRIIDLEDPAFGHVDLVAASWGQTTNWRWAPDSKSIVFAQTGSAYSYTPFIGMLDGTVYELGFKGKPIATGTNLW
ncbi:MAG: hypothetical protein AAF567_19860 [Actinomycetota bacterium]